MSKIEGFALFCDDIRREISGKQILIGLYSGDLIVETFPAEISFATWAKIFGLSKGEHTFTARIHHKDDEIGLNGKGYIDKAEYPLILTMPGASLTVKSEGEMKFEISFDGAPSILLATIFIKASSVENN